MKGFKEKFYGFIEDLVDIVLDMITILVYIGSAFLVSEVFKLTIGQKWPDIVNTTVEGTLIVVGIIGALELIASIVIRAYKKIKNKIDS